MQHGVSYDDYFQFTTIVKALHKHNNYSFYYLTECNLVPRDHWLSGQQLRAGRDSILNAIFPENVGFHS